MNPAIRRVAAVGVAVTLAALVASDLWIGRVEAWWNRHSLTGSVVSSLLVLAVTALIVDEVVARRQRRERAVSVAVQALIVFTQSRRALDAVLTSNSETVPPDRVAEELRTLANMLLTASPNLFDDPVARRFLEEVERFSRSLFREVSRSSKSSTAGLSDEGRKRLVSGMGQLEVTVAPLLARLPNQELSLLEGPAAP